MRIDRNESVSKRSGGELSLIREIRRRAGAGGRGGLRLGIGDDCALLCPRTGEEFAVTTDLSIASRHFELGWHPPEAVGHRTLARGLSDLAAMGARPVAAFLSLGLPKDLTVASGRGRAGKRRWVDGFLDGFFALAQTHNTPLAGGDLAESPVALADIVLVGAVPRGQALLRSGARPGDLIYVTGSLGGAAAGLARLRELAEAGKPSAGDRLTIPKRLKEALGPHLYPQPRLAQGEWLRSRGCATAAVDLSDGLSSDLAHIAEESCVAVLIEAGALPIAPAATLEQALHGGEDYELLFTARPTARIPQAIAGVAVTRIGSIREAEPGEPLVMLATGCVATALKPRGWEHFS